MAFNLLQPSDTIRGHARWSNIGSGNGLLHAKI